MVGESGNPKEWYEEGVEILLQEEGEKQEWLGRVEEYAEENDIDKVEVLNKVVTAAIDDEGEPNLKFKEISGL